METRSKNIQRWMDDVKLGAIRLPRFQREEVWTPEHVRNFLSAILKSRPLGVFLVLEVDTSQQPFETRPLAGAPDNGEPCKQHLLDGQQRLTALWRSFNDNHDNHTFYVAFEKLVDKFNETEIETVSKKGRDKGKIGVPEEEFAKGWVPVKILAPGEEGVKQSIEWCETVFPDEAESRRDISMFVQKLRERMIDTVIPYLPLPQNTSPDEAIDIFIQTNRSAVRLSHYELAVAQMETEISESLPAKIDDLTREVPNIESLEGSNPVGDLVLKVQCVLENKKPTYGNYRNLNFKKLQDNWSKIEEGMKWVTETLGELHIWDHARLPTAVPLRVLSALHHLIPKTGHAHAKARRLVRKYLWWSFFTDRYERQANDRLKEDHDALVQVLCGTRKETSVPAFNCERPDREDLKTAGWPKNRGILSKAILVACSLKGAKDVVTNEVLKQSDNRDYHHIFPKATLKKLGANPDLSLNCMLLTPASNRKEWAKKWPGDFLLEAMQESQFAGNPGAEVKKRLNTHLVRTEHLSAIKENSGVDLRKAYEEFLEKRADMVIARIEKLLNDGEI